MKYLLLILTLLCTYTTQAMELKATVNDEPISDLDITEWANLLKFQQPQKYESYTNEDLQKEALNNLIETMVKKQTAHNEGIKVSNKEIQNAKNHLEQQNGLPIGELNNLLQTQGINAATLQKQIEADLLWLQYLRHKTDDLSISDLAVDKRYQAMKQDLQDKGITGNSITLWEIAQGMFDENVDVTTTLESKDCEAFLEHIKIGTHPESAQSGWTDPNQIAPELYNLLKDVAVGETIGPLRAPNGVLVLMKCNVQNQQVMPEKEQLKMQMEMEQMDVVSRRLMAEAVRRSVIEKKD